MDIRGLFSLFALTGYAFNANQEQWGNSLERRATGDSPNSPTYNDADFSYYNTPNNQLPRIHYENRLGERAHESWVMRTVFSLDSILPKEPILDDAKALYDNVAEEAFRYPPIEGMLLPGDVNDMVVALPPLDAVGQSAKPFVEQLYREMPDYARRFNEQQTAVGTTWRMTLKNATKEEYNPITSYSSGGGGDRRIRRSIEPLNSNLWQDIDESKQLKVLVDVDYGSYPQERIHGHRILYVDLGYYAHPSSEALMRHIAGILYDGFFDNNYNNPFAQFNNSRIADRLVNEALLTQNGSHFGSVLAQSYSRGIMPNRSEIATAILLPSQDGTDNLILPQHPRFDVRRLRLNESTSESWTSNNGMLGDLDLAKALNATMPDSAVLEHFIAKVNAEVMAQVEVLYGEDPEVKATKMAELNIRFYEGMAHFLGRLAGGVAKTVSSIAAVYGKRIGRRTELSLLTAGILMKGLLHEALMDRMGSVVYAPVASIILDACRASGFLKTIPMILSAPMGAAGMPSFLYDLATRQPGTLRNTLFSELGYVVDSITKDLMHTTMFLLSEHEARDEVLGRDMGSHHPSIVTKLLGQALNNSPLPKSTYLLNTADYMLRAVNWATYLRGLWANVERPIPDEELWQQDPSLIADETARRELGSLHYALTNLTGNLATGVLADELRRFLPKGFPVEIFTAIEMQARQDAIRQYRQHAKEHSTASANALHDARGRYASILALARVCQETPNQLPGYRNDPASVNRWLGAILARAARDSDIFTMIAAQARYTAGFCNARLASMFNNLQAAQMEHEVEQGILSEGGLVQWRDEGHIRDVLDKVVSLTVLRDKGRIQANNIHVRDYYYQSVANDAFGLKTHVGTYGSLGYISASDVELTTSLIRNLREESVEPRSRDQRLLDVSKAFFRIGLRNDAYSDAAKQEVLNALPSLSDIGKTQLWDEDSVANSLRQEVTSLVHGTPRDPTHAILSDAGITDMQSRFNTMLQDLGANNIGDLPEEARTEVWDEILKQMSGAVKNQFADAMDSIISRANSELDPILDSTPDDYEPPVNALLTPLARQLLITAQRDVRGLAATDGAHENPENVQHVLMPLALTVNHSCNQIRQTTQAQLDTLRQIENPMVTDQRDIAEHERTLGGLPIFPIGGQRWPKKGEYIFQDDALKTQLAYHAFPQLFEEEIQEQKRLNVEKDAVSKEDARLADLRPKPPRRPKPPEKLPSDDTKSGKNARDLEAQKAHYRNLHDQYLIQQYYQLAISPRRESDWNRFLKERAEKMADFERDYPEDAALDIRQEKLEADLEANRRAFETKLLKIVKGYSVVTAAVGEAVAAQKASESKVFEWKPLSELTRGRLDIADFEPEVLQALERRAFEILRTNGVETLTAKNAESIAPKEAEPEEEGIPLQTFPPLSRSERRNAWKTAYQYGLRFADYESTQKDRETVEQEMYATYKNRKAEAIGIWSKMQHIAKNATHPAGDCLVVNVDEDNNAYVMLKDKEVAEFIVTAASQQGVTLRKGERTPLNFVAQAAAEPKLVVKITAPEGEAISSSGIPFTKTELFRHPQPAGLNCLWKSFLHCLTKTQEDALRARLTTHASQDPLSEASWQAFLETQTKDAVRRFKEWDLRKNPYDPSSGLITRGNLARVIGDNDFAREDPASPKDHAYVGRAHIVSNLRKLMDWMAQEEKHGRLGPDSSLDISDKDWGLKPYLPKLYQGAEFEDLKQWWKAHGDDLHAALGINALHEVVYDVPPMVLRDEPCLAAVLDAPRDQNAALLILETHHNFTQIGLQGVQGNIHQIGHCYTSKNGKIVDSIEGELNVRPSDRIRHREVTAIIFNSPHDPLQQYFALDQRIKDLANTIARATGIAVYPMGLHVPARINADLIAQSFAQLKQANPQHQRVQDIEITAAPGAHAVDGGGFVDPSALKALKATFSKTDGNIIAGLPVAPYCAVVTCEQGALPEDDKWIVHGAEGPKEILNFFRHLIENQRGVEAPNRFDAIQVVRVRNGLLQEARITPIQNETQPFTANEKDIIAASGHLKANTSLTAQPQPPAGRFFATALGWSDLDKGFVLAYRKENQTFLRLPKERIEGPIDMKKAIAVKAVAQQPQQRHPTNVVKRRGSFS